MKKQELKEYVKIIIQSMENALEWTIKLKTKYKNEENYTMYTIYLEKELAEKSHIFDLKRILEKI